MRTKQTALILIGFQNDYFAPDGILHKVIEDSARVSNVLDNTVDLLEHLRDSNVTIISTPIICTPEYRELIEPVGILKTVKEVGAFKDGTKGSETIPELKRFEERIIEVPGKRGLSAYSNTDLEVILSKHEITDVILAGVITSVCIDSTGRASAELGYKVSILSDCTSGRSVFEQDYYLGNIFPIYANVLDHHELLKQLEN